MLHMYSLYFIVISLVSLRMRYVHITHFQAFPSTWRRFVTLTTQYSKTALHGHLGPCNEARGNNDVINKSFIRASTTQINFA